MPAKLKATTVDGIGIIFQLLFYNIPNRYIIMITLLLSYIVSILVPT